MTTSSSSSMEKATALALAYAHARVSSGSSKGSLRAEPRDLVSHSFANLSDVTFHHLHWTLEVDFAAQQLRGTAEYTFTYDSLSPEVPVVALDTRGLAVESVLVDGRPAPFELQDARDGVARAFGRALVVAIAAHAKKLRVVYATLPADPETASALQWLPRELTAGGTHPFLYTQCQAIHARSIVPAPDTPSAKFTYTAVVTVPEWSTVLLSATADETGKHKRKAAAAVPAGKRVVSFRQDVPIPSYLLAIAVGRLECAELGPRSRVWAEPSVVAKAAHEFAQTEAFLQHAEEITGQPYVWKRYDLVCLPPSFPYGGMENPCLTFVTPTLLAGDRSLADVVAHEISHSWTGNLVTNYSWRDFWLNEGWTIWLERKIQTRIHDDPLAYDLKATMGLRALVESVKVFGATHPYTHLVPDVDGVDPDEVFSSIPYEKGFNFLHYLITVVGGHDVFDAFAKAYIRHFRFKTLTSEDFRDFFVQYFTTTVDKRDAIQQIDWQAWYHSPGMPPVAVVFDTSLSSQAISLGERILANPDPATWPSRSSPSSSAAGVDAAAALKKWPVTLWILLLDTLLLKQSELNVRFSPAHLDAIDRFCDGRFTTTRNAELRVRWYTLSLRSGDVRLLNKIASFLREQGRMKYVRPLFRELCRAAGPAYAIKIFAQSKRLYHPIAVKMIQRDIESAFAAAASSAASKRGDSGFNVVLARWLGIPEAYASYSPIAAVALTVVVAGTAAVIVSRRRR